jgi:DNA repair exonuclease SbcCD ATPase subunit
MRRFLSSTLLFLIALPLFAQDEPPVLEQMLARDPATLMRMREQLTFEYRETQRALSAINPNDTQLVETLKTRQADLAKQMNDIVKQLQTLGSSQPGIGEFPPDMNVRPGLTPGLPTTQPLLPITTRMDDRRPPSLSELNAPGIPVIPPGVYPPTQPYMPYSPAYNPPDIPNMPQWGNPPPQAWEWGPRLPKELTEVKQSVESLQKEIADLREIVERLETQIQLLNRTVLLSSERQNDPAPSPKAADEGTP